MRNLRVAAAQVGGIQPEETRTEVVERLLDLLERAAGAGCRLVVFPELTLTTFFPRTFFEDASAADIYFETAMPGPETQALFDASRRLGVGFHLGYAELVRKADQRPALQYRDPGGPGRDPREVPEDPSPRALGTPARGSLPASGKALLRGRRPRVSPCGASSAGSSGCASATTAAGRRPTASSGSRASR